jgi:hypothetical protein
MMRNETEKYEADFVFIKNGGVYFIEKDRYGWLSLFVAVDENTVKDFLESGYKTTILNTKGEVIMQNFKGIDLKAVQELLSDIEKSYEEKLRILEEIDKALDEGDKETFMILTEKLYKGA